MSANSGEPPVEQEHRDDGRDHRRHVRQHRGRGRGDDVVDAADVVRDPALHLAGARAGEEREREPLQVAVDRRAQVVHHGLADLVREQRLEDADRAGDDRDHDHPGDERGQQPHVVVGDRRVEDARSRNAGMTPSAAEKTIRAKTTASCGRYARKSGKIRRRFAFRTAGSAGRSGGSAVSAPKRRPGICLECLPRGQPGSDASRDRARALRCRAPRPPPAAGPSARARARPSAPPARRRSARRSGPRAAGTRRVPGPSAFRVPSSRTGRSGAPAASAIRAAPRSHGPSRAHAALGEDADDLAASSAATAAAIAPTSLRPRCDRDRLDAVEPPAEQRDAPQLGLGEIADRPRDRGGEDERIEHRVVVRRDDERPGAGTCSGPAPRAGRRRGRRGVSERR